MKSLSRGWLPQVVLAAALILLLWISRGSLGPIAILIVAWTLWWPLRRTRSGHAILGFLIALVVLWILHQARWVVYPLAGGGLLACVLGPLVAWLVGRGLRRGFAVLLPLLGLGLVVLASLLLLIPAVTEQIQILVLKLPDAYRVVHEWISPLASKLDISQGGTQSVLPDSLQLSPGTPASAGIPAWLQQLVSHAEALIKGALGGLSEVGKGLGRLLQWLSVLLLTPVVAYYLLLDWDRVRSELLELLPERWRETARRLGQDLENALTRYVRGQLLVAAIETVLFTVAFLVAGLPSPIALAVLCGLLTFVPILGFWATVLLVALSALTSGEPWPTLLKAGVGLTAISILESQLIVPRVQGSGLGLPVLVVLLGVLLFAALLGLPGILLAVPAMGVLRANLPSLRRAYLESRFYTGKRKSDPRGDS